MNLTREILLLTLIFVTTTTRAQDQDIRLPPTIDMFIVYSETQVTLRIVESSERQVTFRQGDHINFMCSATGAGNLTFEWIQNNTPMNLSEFPRIHIPWDRPRPPTRFHWEGELMIWHAERRDEGFYQCLVSNAYGKALSNIFYLQLASMGEAATKEVFENTVQEGQPFEIRAQPHKSFPRPIYSWEMVTSTEDTSPRQVILNKRIQMDEDGNLHFAYATLNDSINGNIYRLITFNKYLNRSLGGSYTKIKVDPARDGIKNLFPKVRFPQNASYVGVVGRSITLRCFIGAYPEVTANDWSPPAGLKHYHDIENYNTEFIIRYITPEDQGDYFCAASNTLGRKLLSIPLEVQAAPEFKSVKDGLQNINATEEDTVTFQCTAEGKPSVTTVWYMNGNILNNNNIPRRMRISSNNQTLTIENVCRDCLNDDRKTDLMVIQCNVSNVHGHTFSTGYLNILKKTVVTSISAQDKVEVKRDEPGEVIFKCTANSDPSTPVSIEWRKVDPEHSKNDYIIYPDNEVIFMDEPGQIRFNVQQNNTAIWLEVMGLYRCKANNSYSSDFKVMRLTVEGIPVEKENTTDAVNENAGNLVPAYLEHSYYSRISPMIIIFIVIIAVLVVALLIYVVRRCTARGISQMKAGEYEVINKNNHKYQGLALQPQHSLADYEHPDEIYEYPDDLETDERLGEVEEEETNDISVHSPPLPPERRTIQRGPEITQQVYDENCNQEYEEPLEIHDTTQANGSEADEITGVNSGYLTILPSRQNSLNIADDHRGSILTSEYLTMPHDAIL